VAERSPVWDEHVALPIMREDPTTKGGVMLYHVWRCMQPGNKTDGVANFRMCLRIKKLPPEDVSRPTCKRHPRRFMERSANVYKMPDGTLVRRGI